ncbi:MAG: glycoside hydrolase family 43 protein [Acidimicrobiales bacterium]
MLTGVLLAACGPAAGIDAGRSPLNVSVEPTSRPGQLPVPAGRSPTLGPQAFHPSETGGVQLDVINALRDGTPIFNGDFADPSALKTSQALYLFASDTAASRYAPAAHIPEIELTQSSAFRGYYLGDALPRLPKWTVAGFQWAPSVWARPNGIYVMYYSTPAAHPLECVAKPSGAGCIRTANGPTSAMCISAATSTNPAGPYVDDSSSAFVCPASQGGAIDPSIFIAQHGAPWLLWKSDGDCCGLPTIIYSQQLAPDGLATVGPPHQLIRASQPWEGGLVEGPAIVESNGNFWLFYSANKWGTDHYGIGIAHCSSVIGPCTKPLSHAWLSSSGGSQTDPGPGGEEFFQAGGLVWMVHHGLDPLQTGNLAQRRLYVDLLAFPNGRLPRIASGNAAAALAEGVLYNEDPNLPAQPRAAYLLVLKKMTGAFSADSDGSVLADGMLSCHDLGHHESPGQMLGSLQHRGLNPFEAYLVAIFSTKYFCSQYVPQALVDVRQSLVDGP